VRAALRDTRFCMFLRRDAPAAHTRAPLALHARARPRLGTHAPPRRSAARAGGAAARGGPAQRQPQTLYRLAWPATAAADAPPAAAAPGRR
jgi:hypothetical protein